MHRYTHDTAGGADCGAGDCQLTSNQPSLLKW